MMMIMMMLSLLFLTMCFLMSIQYAQNFCHQLWQFSWDIVTDHGKLIVSALVVCFFSSFVLIFCWFYSVDCARALYRDFFRFSLCMQNAFPFILFVRLAAKSLQLFFIAVTGFFLCIYSNCMITFNVSCLHLGRHSFYLYNVQLSHFFNILLQQQQQKKINFFFLHCVLSTL